MPAATLAAVDMSPDYGGGSRNQMCLDALLPFPDAPYIDGQRFFDGEWHWTFYLRRREWVGVRCGEGVMADDDSAAEKARKNLDVAAAKLVSEGKLPPVRAASDEQTLLDEASEITRRAQFDGARQRFDAAAAALAASGGEIDPELLADDQVEIISALDLEALGFKDSPAWARAVLNAFLKAGGDRSEFGSSFRTCCRYWRKTDARSSVAPLFRPRDLPRVRRPVFGQRRPRMQGRSEGPADGDGSHDSA